jgi:hypothetical protein
MRARKARRPTQTSPTQEGEARPYTVMSISVLALRSSAFSTAAFAAKL